MVKRRTGAAPRATQAFMMGALAKVCVCVYVCVCVNIVYTLCACCIFCASCTLRILLRVQHARRRQCAMCPHATDCDPGDGDGGAGHSVRIANQGHLRTSCA